MTGTRRCPPLSFSMRSRSAAFLLTFTYSKATPRRRWSSSAACVYGQLSLPKMVTMVTPPLASRASGEARRLRLRRGDETAGGDVDHIVAVGEARAADAVE